MTNGETAYKVWFCKISSIPFGELEKVMRKNTKHSKGVSQ